MTGAVTLRPMTVVGVPEQPFSAEDGQTVKESKVTETKIKKANTREDDGRLGKLYSYGIRRARDTNLSKFTVGYLVGGGLCLYALYRYAPASLVHRENPRPMDVVMNGWLRLP